MDKIGISSKDYLAKEFSRSFRVSQNTASKMKSMWRLDLVEGDTDHGERIESLSKAAFTKLSDLLDHHRGNLLRNASERLSAMYWVLQGTNTSTKYVFESLEESVLKETFDSPELVDKLSSLS